MNAPQKHVCEKLATKFLKCGDLVIYLPLFCNWYGCLACRLRRLAPIIDRIALVLLCCDLWQYHLCLTPTQRDSVIRRARRQKRLYFSVGIHVAGRTAKVWHIYTQPLAVTTRYPGPQTLRSQADTLAHVKAITDTPDLAHVHFARTCPRTTAGAREFNRLKRRKIEGPTWTDAGTNGLRPHTVRQFIRENTEIDVAAFEPMPAHWVEALLDSSVRRRSTPRSPMVATLLKRRSRVGLEEATIRPSSDIGDGERPQDDWFASFSRQIE